MNLLYSFHYKERFKRVIKYLSKFNPKSVKEICFGDIHIASYCQKNNISWKGYEFNPNFIDYAIRSGFNVVYSDVSKEKNFINTDVTVIMGSLYHFRDNIEDFFNIILKSTNKAFIISEPVINLSSRNDFIGKLARRLTKVRHGSHEFRYNRESLEKLIRNLSVKQKFKYQIHELFRKDLIISITQMKLLTIILENFFYSI